MDSRRPPTFLDQDRIVGVKVPVDLRFMVLFDFEIFQVVRYRILLANLLTAASLLIAKIWKLGTVPSLEDWITKITYMCPMSKLSSLAKYREGAGQVLAEYNHCWTL